jgi:hypothetical protein
VQTATRLALALAALLPPPTFSAEAAEPRVPVDILAVSGDPSPDGDGEMASFTIPSINAAGDVVFHARLAHGVGSAVEDRDTIVVFARGGSLATIARQSDELSWLGPIHLDETGTAHLQSWSLYEFDPVDGLRLVVAPGDPAPGIDTPFAGIEGLVTSAPGHSAFKSHDDKSLWLMALEEAPVAVALAGEPAPGTDPDVLFASFSAPVVNDSGAVAFHAQLEGPGSAPSAGVWWREPGGALLPVVRNGDPAPGASSGTLHSAGIQDLGDSNALALRGSIAVEGEVSFDDEAIWTGHPGDLHVAVREGDAAPTGVPGEIFREVGYDVSIDAAERVAFDALLEASAGTRDSLWRADDLGQLELLLVAGEPLDGGSRARIAEIGETAVSDDGAVASRVLTRAGDRWQERSALLYLAPSGERVVPFAPGDRIQVRPGDRRRVRNVYLGEGAHQRIGRRALSESGQVAVLVEFANETQAIAVVTVPEAGAVTSTLAGCAALSLARACRRRRAAA